MHKAIFAVSAGLVGSAHAFWRMECPGRVGLARMDPIVNPGGFSDHLHTIHGSSGFDTVADTKSLLKGGCTSCRVTQDKSSYWHPAMYFEDEATGKLELVEQVGGMLAYYLLTGDNIKAFPTDFEMIAGNNKRRTFNAGEVEPMNQKSFPPNADQDYLEQLAVGFNCLNYGGTPEPTLGRHKMPEKSFLDSNCKNGLRLELMFPRCWDGKNTKSSDHKSHVAYPSSVMDGVCPDGFPTTLPGLLFETVWATHEFANRKGRFVMSNGDPTGFGYHGDFVMGWEEDFLQQAVDTCTNDSGRIEDCPIFDIIDEAEAQSCDMQAKPAELLKEEVTKGLSVLPGGMKIFGEGEKPEVKKPESPAEQPTKSLELPVDQPSQDLLPVVAEEPTLPPAVENAAIPAPEEPKNEPEPAPAPEPATTDKPVEEPADPNMAFARTEYVTNGGVVSKILWQEETVWVTELAGSTGAPQPPSAEQELIDPAPVPRRIRRSAHLHRHGRQHV